MSWLKPRVSGGGQDRRRWLLLIAIGLAQLKVVLDLTVMNIALPSAQRALGFSTVDRQWVVTAYTLSFGSLPPGYRSDWCPALNRAAAPALTRPEPHPKWAA